MHQYGPWVVSKIKDKFYLRRELLPRNRNAKWESYKGNYNTSDRDEVDALKRRLNARFIQEKQQHEARYDFNYTYFNKPLIERFEGELWSHTDTKDHVTRQLSYLNIAFTFFVHKMKLPVPTDWIKHQAAFGKHIESLKLGHDSMSRIIQATNRYLKFLNVQYPEEIPPILLQPIAKKKLKDMARLAKNDLQNGNRFIDDDSYKLILKHVDPKIKPHLILAYSFGLRRAEILGLKPSCFYKGYLQVKEQLKRVDDGEGKPVYGPLKNRDQRRVPYWFIKNTTALELVQDMKIMHPDTLGHEVSKEMTRINELIKVTQKVDMNINYELHDFRRTFITRAVKKYEINEVRLAAGHSDLSTTSGYLQDDRNLDDEPLV